MGVHERGGPDPSSLVEIAFRTLAPSTLAFLRTQDLVDPEDVLGDVFVQVTRSIGSFEGDAAALRRWVFTIARNVAADDRRRRRRRPRVVGSDLPEAEAPLPGSIDPTLVEALRTLTEEQREVVVLRYVADLSLEDVAEVTGRPLGAVKSMQHRALASLARTLDGNDAGEG